MKRLVSKLLKKRQTENDLTNITNLIPTNHPKKLLDFSISGKAPFYYCFKKFVFVIQKWSKKTKKSWVDDLTCVI